MSADSTTQPAEPTVVATPEGDNEFPPDAPLNPLPEGALLTPNGAAPDSSL
jgi:hypothetical protein